MTNEELIQRAKGLEDRRRSLQVQRARLEGEHKSLRQQHDAALKELQAAGYNVSNIDEEIDNARKALIEEMDVVDKALTEAENQIARYEQRKAGV